MPERTAVIASSVGLHARPATLFVNAVTEQAVPVTIRKGDGPAGNAASILTVMALGAAKGETVTLAAEGDGADQALDTLVALLETDLDAS
ncbi:phosphocarrier protein HPr [Homoserinimonas aerilata]|uniref:Phosphocarrier protein HPr n=1 Tax=Homoserinimonas aerilata TaxID=1162970 RepID=A0A542YGJ7_9MICO|nr:HPr family phosphocarrier protein [Homoserinimonas aerilata]TQL47220.1 phosphocarrier protein HPr [Homoserinimonas aerilata]